MLIRYIDLLFQDPVTFFTYVPLLIVLVGFGLLVGITVHEFSHALVAHSMGDTTAKRLGRLTLNPRAHLDPMGTILLFVAGFGWGKPVPVNPDALSYGRQGMALVAAAGPLSNVATAFIFAIPFKLGVLSWQSPRLLDLSFSGGGEVVATIFAFVIFFNLVLAAFNLLPFFPLDGSKVLMGILPRDMADVVARLEPYGPVLLLFVIIVDYTTGLGLLWRFLGPVVNYLSSVVTGT